MTRSEHDFSKGSISRNILTLAAPMTAAQLINVLYSVVDRIYLGRLPGHLALTGLGLVMPIISIVMGFANLCGTGGAPLCSIQRGRGDTEEAERVMGNAFTLLLIFGAAVTAVFLALQRPMLYLFGASDATYPYASAYFTVYLSGTVFALLSTGLSQSQPSLSNRTRLGSRFSSSAPRLTSQMVKSIRFPSAYWTRQ